MIMEGLVHDVEEGVPGEYRKALTEDVHPLMSWWYESLKQQKDEHIVAFLMRIHSEFQRMHAFIVSNGHELVLAKGWLSHSGLPYFIDHSVQPWS